MRQTTTNDTGHDDDFTLVTENGYHVLVCQRCGWRSDPSPTRVALIRLNGPMNQHERRAHAAGRKVSPPASAKQRAYVQHLATTHETDQATYRRATAENLTHADCQDLIPLLKSLPERGHDDWSTPEGYDDSPDQGVHRFDGGGSW